MSQSQRSQKERWDVGDGMEINDLDKSNLTDTDTAANFFFFSFMKGTARTLVPTTKNYALEPPRFGVVAGVSPCGVQCTGLVLEAPPS